MPADSKDQAVILRSKITKRSAITLSLIAAFNMVIIWIVFAGSLSGNVFASLFMSLVSTLVTTYVVSHCTKTLRIYNDCLIFNSWFGQRVVFKKDMVRLESGMDSEKSVKLVLRSFFPVYFHADHWTDGADVVKTVRQWAKEAIEQNRIAMEASQAPKSTLTKLGMTTETRIANLRRSLKDSQNRTATPAEKIAGDHAKVPSERHKVEGSLTGKQESLADSTARNMRRSLAKSRKQSVNPAEEILESESLDS